MWRDHCSFLHDENIEHLDVVFTALLQDTVIGLAGVVELQIERGPIRLNQSALPLPLLAA